MCLRYTSHTWLRLQYALQWGVGLYKFVYSALKNTPGECGHVAAFFLWLRVGLGVAFSRRRQGNAGQLAIDWQRFRLAVLPHRAHVPRPTEICFIQWHSRRVASALSTGAVLENSAALREVSRIVYMIDNEPL